MFTRNVLLILMTGVAVDAAAQTVHGRLLDSETQAAIEGGTVVLLSEDSVAVGSALTTSSGEFRLTAPEPGGYRLSAERAGYRSAASPIIEMRADDTLEVEFLISMEAVLLQPLNVVASSTRPQGRLGGFYERAERGGLGSFITRDEIEKRQPVYPSDLLRGIPGVQVVPTWWGRALVVMRGRCVPQIYLDGMRIGTASIDELVSTLELEGIEVYRGIETPVEFSGFSSCGALVLWTRRGA